MNRICITWDGFGGVTATDVDKKKPEWWDFVVREFFRYYQHDPAYGTLEDSREAVRYHAKSNYRRIFHREKRDVKKRVRNLEGRGSQTRLLTSRPHSGRGFSSGGVLRRTRRGPKLLQSLVLICAYLILAVLPHLIAVLRTWRRV